MKPDNATAAKAIDAIAQCRTASDDTAPIRAQSPRAPLTQRPLRTDHGLATAIRSSRRISPGLICTGSATHTQWH
jgi:hypothetical protein